MVNALHAFGLAIGWMDILGVLVFELMIFYFMCSRAAQEAPNDAEVPPDEGVVKQQRKPLTGLFGPRYLKDSTKTWIFWAYLFLLNVWIVVTFLMIAGITWVSAFWNIFNYPPCRSLHSQQKPELMICWLIWCVGGIFLDVFFVLWWCIELCAGDAIEALTNIIISLLTMIIEFGFIFVIFTIYTNLSSAPNENVKDSGLFLIVKNAMDPSQWIRMLFA
ncbi:uncharacterized protein LOC108150809 isoform X1 [Drosophila miranda]|uniref:uncharacterized protein LOC108150809 isoform X1 n=1 Tax=Drosophila miranda TaxID=7229 RepID=UPI0007E6DE1F|nr:uncharacterized protein LOC108150809 isoform X1 [Drosophila miranda]